MTMRAPLAVELGWFLVSNSGSLPAAPESIVAEYRQALEWDSGRWGFGGDAHDFAALAGDWDTQLDLTWIVGLLLRGWRKGLDAEAGVTLASRVSAADDLAWWCEAVEAPSAGSDAAPSVRTLERRCSVPKTVPQLPGIPPSDYPVLAGRRGERLRLPGRPGRRRARAATAPSPAASRPRRARCSTTSAACSARPGSASQDVVKCTVYLRDFSEFAAMNAVYREYFPTDPPTRATVGVTALAADYRSRDRSPSHALTRPAGRSRPRRRLSTIASANRRTDATERRLGSGSA